MDNLTKDAIAAARAGMSYGRWKAELDYFMYMRTKTVKVEWGNRYETAKKAANNIARSVQRWAFPIDVRRFGDDVYLIRRDM